MKRVVLAVSMFLLMSSSLLAVGAGSSPSPSGPMITPEQQAMDRYNAGIAKRDKALKLLEEAKTADAAKAQKLTDGAKKNFERAVGDFKRASDLKGQFYQAYSELGFVLRKLGRWDESLAAYDKALSIEPRYSLAIEYRAEAYLGLNRVDDAKQAYMLLFSGDRARADILFEAMKEWVGKRRAEAASGGADPQAVEAFAKWVEQREALQKQTSALYGKDALPRNW